MMCSVSTSRKYQQKGFFIEIVTEFLSQDNSYYSYFLFLVFWGFFQSREVVAAEVRSSAEAQLLQDGSFICGRHTRRLASTPAKIKVAI